MTANTIANFRAHEEARANRKQEALKRLEIRETRKHNRATEEIQLTDVQNKIVQTALKSQEVQETIRHNAVTEGISQQEAEAKMKTALATELKNSADAWNTYNFSADRVKAELIKAGAAKTTATVNAKESPYRIEKMRSESGLNSARTSSVWAEMSKIPYQINDLISTVEKTKSETDKILAQIPQVKAETSNTKQKTTESKAKVGKINYDIAKEIIQATPMYKTLTDPKRWGVGGVMSLGSALDLIKMLG